MFDGLREKLRSVREVFGTSIAEASTSSLVMPSPRRANRASPNG